MAHTPPIIIDNLTKTVAYFSSEKPRNLVIFVHGFNGHSTETWDAFPEMIHQVKDFKYSDIIFYGYKSLEYQANVHAQEFKTFLLEYSESMVMRNYFTRNPLPKTFRYPNIVLVAHSLGAIVVRRALLLIKGQSPNHNVIKKSKMVLFAPAHRGTLIKDNYLSGLPGIFGIAGMIGILAVPVLKNLQPNSSTITNLHSDTQKLINSNNGAFTVARKVIWAQKERVVFQDYFDDNESPEILKNTMHTSVCKPVYREFMDPLKFVVQELN